MGHPLARLPGIGSPLYSPRAQRVGHPSTVKYSYPDHPSTRVEATHAATLDGGVATDSRLTGY
jgi:hypothetical protein